MSIPTCNLFLCFANQSVVFLHARVVCALCIPVNIIPTLVCFLQKAFVLVSITCSISIELTILSHFNHFLASGTQSQASLTSTFMVLIWIQKAHSDGIKLQVSQGGQYWTEMMCLPWLPIVIDNRRLATIETGVFRSISTCPHTVSSKSNVNHSLSLLYVPSQSFFLS